MLEVERDQSSSFTNDILQHPLELRGALHIELAAHDNGPGANGLGNLDFELFDHFHVPIGDR